MSPLSSMALEYALNVLIHARHCGGIAARLQTAALIHSTVNAIRAARRAI
ncbi:hypothetical protein [Azohydromonas aeria]|nr:hypothetical protein [Azohydromonas aeria]